MKVTLVAYSSPGGLDPRRLVLLAIKVSQGKVREKGVEHYLRDYPERDVSEWVLKAAEFPSVLEHVVFTFYIEGISRVASHQLVRHRIASYTQESQRYAEVWPDYVVPKTVVERGFVERYKDAVERCYRVYEAMLDSGVPLEDARYVLPQAFTTSILMTVNLRELVHIACLRLSEKAQWELREVVKAMVEEASRVVPEVRELVSRMCGGGGP
ncbi:MAG: FAD-dependent thymidylate synthase [Thermosphaera sp.]|nr:FAD-dependent thymidylate synthase [Thermosphaera sp.]